MVKVEFTFNDDHAAFQDDLWNEVDRLCNIMKQNIYKALNDGTNSPVICIKTEATGAVVESNGNICGQWKVTKNLGETA